MNTFRFRPNSIYDLDLSQVPIRSELANHNEPCWHCSTTDIKSILPDEPTDGLAVEYWRVDDADLI